jgi:CTD kinase subunit alpha
MFLKRPLFPGNDEMTQVDLIWRVCGTPSVDEWPGVESLAWWGMLRPKEVKARMLRESMRRYELYLM